MKPEQILIFDGACAMCSGLVQFVIKRDRRARIQLVAAQSELGQRLQRHFDADVLALDTVVVVEAQRVLIRSGAALAITRKLDGPWRLFAMFRLLPSGPMDWLYKLIAKRRMRWFGQAESCLMPTVETAAHFLPGDWDPAQD